MFQKYLYEIYYNKEKFCFAFYITVIFLIYMGSIFIVVERKRFLKEFYYYYYYYYYYY